LLRCKHTGPDAVGAKQPLLLLLLLLEFLQALLRLLNALLLLQQLLLLGSRPIPSKGVTEAGRQQPSLVLLLLLLLLWLRYRPQLLRQAAGCCFCQQLLELLLITQPRQLLLLPLLLLLLLLELWPLLGDLLLQMLNPTGDRPGLLFRQQLCRCYQASLWVLARLCECSILCCCLWKQ
jgi:hypothetical protein